MATKDKKIKVLAYCDMACATGFATVAKNILMGLHNSGAFEITVLGINHHGNPHPFPFPIWPVLINAGSSRDPYGREWAKKMFMQMEYDILFTLQDSFILEFMKEIIADMRNRNPKMRWINYFPVDGVPKKAWIEAMSKADYVFTYTDWGVKMCSEVFPPIKEKIAAVPHGINQMDFFPLPKSEKEKFRRDFFGPHTDKFVVLNVNRNQQRKDLPRSMQAFKKFNAARPNSVYYIHAAVQDHGWNLFDVASNMGLRVNENICFPDGLNPNQGYPINIVNNIYNAADVVISSTLGEGWGLAQIEAMATCTPVISPDNTACSEILADDRGILVRSGWDEEAFTVLCHDNEINRPLSHIGDMANALIKLHDDKNERQRLAINGYKWVTSTLRWDKNIVPLWEKVFSEAVKSAVSTPEFVPGLSLVEI